jgi:hypothetical protein
VRLSKAKRMFKKGYLPNWTEELFTIVRCIETRPPVFLIKDDHGEILEGTFYSTVKLLMLTMITVHRMNT